MVLREVPDFNTRQPAPARFATLAFKRQVLRGLFIGDLITECNPLDPVAEQGVVQPYFEISVLHHRAGKPAFDNDIIALSGNLFLARID